jgi:hypothetical protein
MKYYPSDWRGDPALRMCSLAARGLWIEMIGLMHESSTPGHLLLNARSPNTAQLASLVGADIKTVGKTIQELEDAAVFSRTDEGVIFSRRMVRDHRKSLAGKEAIARRWGGETAPISNEDRAPNSAPIRSDGRSEDRKPITHARARSRTISQKVSKQQRELDGVRQPSAPTRMPCRGDPPSEWLQLVPDRGVHDDGATHAVVGGYSLSIAAEAVCDAAGINDAHWRGDWQFIIAWMADGFDLHERILPVIRQVASRPGYRPATKLKYFDGAIREQRGSR